jgi:hypothetical protein
MAPTPSDTFRRRATVGLLSVLGALWVIACGAVAFGWPPF